MTAQALPGDEQRLRSAGLSDYISKPIDEERLSTVLEPWLPDLKRRPDSPADWPRRPLRATEPAPPICYSLRSMRIRGCSFALSLLIGLPYLTPGAEAATPAEPVVKALTAAAMLDVATGDLVPDAVVLIEGDRIQAAGSKLEIPAGAEVIDLGQATLLPGLIDCHTHITTRYEHLLFGGPMYDAVTAPGNARKTLEAGITTVRDLWSKDYIDVALRDAIDNGDVIGPRILAATLAIGSTGGHNEDVLGLSPTISINDHLGIADGVDAVRRLVRTELKYGADVIKLMATEGAGEGHDVENETQFTLEEMQAVVEETHRYGKKVAAHAHGADGIKKATEAGVDSIEHGTLLDAEGVQLMKRHGTYLVPTGVMWTLPEETPDSGAPEWKRERQEGFRKGSPAGFRMAVEAGVKIAMGSDAPEVPHGDNPREIVWMATHGMTPLQAIQAATTNAADLLGWSDRVGVLAAGRFADVVAVSGNPLEEIELLEDIPFVMKGGVVIQNRLSAR